VDSVTEVSHCLSCTAGNMLKDDASECLDASALDCPGAYEDRGAECSSCAADYVASPDKAVCTQYCYVCGDISSDKFVTVSACDVSGNSSILERCDTGSCWVS